MCLMILDGFQAYLKKLKSNFSKLSLSPELFKRTLIVNYTDDKDLRKGQ